MYFLLQGNNYHSEPLALFARGFFLSYFPIIFQDFHCLSRYRVTSYLLCEDIMQWVFISMIFILFAISACTPKSEDKDNANKADEDEKASLPEAITGGPDNQKSPGIYCLDSSLSTNGLYEFRCETLYFYLISSFEIEHSPRTKITERQRKAPDFSHGDISRCCPSSTGQHFFDLTHRAPFLGLDILLDDGDRRSSHRANEVGVAP